MDISQQFAKAAVGSGNYELGLALRDRTTIDNEAILEARTALQAQKLQWELDQQRMAQEAEYNERYLRLQTRLSGGGEDASTGEGYADAASALQSYIDTPKIGTGTADVPAAPNTWEDANKYIAALETQYQLSSEETLRLYQLNDIRYGKEVRGASSVGAGAGTTAAATAASAKAASQAASIPYGEDPNKPWERQLTNKQKDAVALPIKEAYNKTYDVYDNDDERNALFTDPTRMRQLVMESLKLEAKDGKFFKDGKPITENEYNGFVSYGEALLAIRINIGGDMR